ncbi:MAG: DUF6252 family protein [Ginsengibacter sp.]
MKYRLLILVICFSFIIVIASRCKKDKGAIEQLPPETQTGAGTFGCLIDGIVFKPKGDPFGGPILSCAYQYINGGYYFQLKASDKSSPTIFSIGIFTDSLKIEEGLMYSLQNKNMTGEAYGTYLISEIQGLNAYLTSTINAGEFKVKKLDETNRIISGTFWFNAFNSSGEKVQVSEGRFDMKYTL